MDQGIVEADLRRMRMTADITAAYLSRNTTSDLEAPAQVVSIVAGALASLDAPPPPVALERPKPAVPISRSVQHDHIVCLEDGKRLKMLKRYLRAQFDMSPEEYRRRWGLAPDYPMVAPAYSARRSEFAKHIGLGRSVRRA